MAYIIYIINRVFSNNKIKFLQHNFLACDD